jgi:hypothetical protein
METPAPGGAPPAAGGKFQPGEAFLSHTAARRDRDISVVWRPLPRPYVDSNNAIAAAVAPGSIGGIALAGLLRMAPSIKGKRAFLSTILALGIACAGCDTFFTFDAVVTDCASGLPLEGVAITVRIDKGVSAEGYIGVPDTTDAAGKIHIELNQPDSDVVTIGLVKTGYQTWTHQYDGQPKGQVAVCLTPSP